MTKFLSFFSILTLGVLALAEPAFAAPDLQLGLSQIAKNIASSVSSLPNLISAASYLFGLMFAIGGIVALKSHVENAQQTPARKPIIRLLVGGGFFALPMVYEAMRVSIDGGVNALFEPGVFSPVFALSGLFGKISSIFGDFGITIDFNAVLTVMVESLSDVPGLVSVFAYLLGLTLGAIGLLKLRDHVENPDQVPLKEAVIRFIIGGAFFALPTIYMAMEDSITGGNGIGLAGNLAGALDVLARYFSPYDAGTCLDDNILNLIGMGKGSVGSALCGILAHTSILPAFLNSLSYIFGLVLGFWALLKLRDHVLNPNQTPLWDGIARLLAGGAFFALPVVVEVVRATVTPASSIVRDVADVVDATGILDIVGIGNPFSSASSYNVDPSICDGDNALSAGLDGRLYCAVTDILMPMNVVLNFFAFSAGMIFIMIGISRLLKSAQDGPRGPGGIGTIMTFVTGGMLISFNEFVRLATMTLFSQPQTATFAKLGYTNSNGGAAGMALEEIAHFHTVVSAILKFMIIIGLISFARGIFIIRGVSEGNNQASLMAGMTHMIGGAVAVNLGPLLNLVQMTLGINPALGITFL